MNLLQQASTGTVTEVTSVAMPPGLEASLMDALPGFVLGLLGIWLTSWLAARHWRKVQQKVYEPRLFFEGYSRAEDALIIEVKNYGAGVAIDATLYFPTFEPYRIRHIMAPQQAAEAVLRRSSLEARKVLGLPPEERICTVTYRDMWDGEHRLTAAVVPESASGTGAEQVAIDF